MRILFRADAGIGIGLGHLQRCVSLALALQNSGSECIFLVANQPAVQSGITRYGFATHAFESDSKEEPDQVVAIATDRSCTAVVIDSYRIGPLYMARLREAGLVVAAIDDLAQFPFPCHLVVNGGPSGRRLDYRSSTGDTLFLLGPEYALLRPEFWNSKRETVRDRVHAVLVTLGGADGRHLTPTILEVLDSLHRDFEVTATVGPFFTNKTEVNAIAKACRTPVKIVDSPGSVAPLMEAADFAISAGGQTLFELAATGTPTIAIQTVENQAENVRSLANHGAVIPIVFEDLDQLRRSLGDHLSTLLDASEIRCAMSRAGQALIDGRGASRCAVQLLTLCRQISEVG